MKVYIAVIKVVDGTDGDAFDVATGLESRPWIEEAIVYDSLEDLLADKAEGHLEQVKS